MGYNYSADFTFHVSEATSVALALDLPRLHEQSTRNSIDQIPLFDSADFLGEIFQYLDFEVDSEEQETVWSGQTQVRVTTYKGSVNTKLRPTLDTILVWLASCGVGISMNCRGEDDEMWQYQSETLSGQLTSRTLTTVTNQDLAKLRAAEKTVKAIIDSVDENQFVDPYVVIRALDIYRAAAVHG